MRTIETSRGAGVARFEIVSRASTGPGTIVAALAAAAAVLAGCGDGSVGPWGPPNLAVGTWGGEGAGVIVTDSGVHVHIGCTFGDIPGVPDLDEDGRFSADGSYQPRAFPVVSGPTVPARFSGRVEGRTLILAVAVDDTVIGEVGVLGPVSVVYDREPQLGICPICRIPGVRMPPSETALPSTASRRWSAALRPRSIRGWAW